MLASRAISWIVTLILLSVALVSAGRNETSLGVGQFTNPLRQQNGSDPFIVYNEGYYYLMSTTWKDIQLTRAQTLEGLKLAKPKTVYRGTDPNVCCNVWAPEIHDIDGIWYIYFTAGQEKDLGFQRPHALKGGPSPWDPYKYAGSLSNEWGIDGTVSVINAKRYFIWSCQRNKMQSLCIARMTSPVRLAETHVISQPTNGWERAEGKLPVNEGPAVMQRGGKVFMTFSASYCWTTSYSLGLLTLKDGRDPLEKESWSKSGPVFRSANGNFGPGHNGFFSSPDGKEIWNVYHATSNSKGSCDGHRYTMAEVVNWDQNGKPDFGKPTALFSQIRTPSGE